MKVRRAVSMEAGAGFRIIEVYQSKANVVCCLDSSGCAGHATTDAAWESYARLKLLTDAWSIPMAVFSCVICKDEAATYEIVVNLSPKSVRIPVCYLHRNQLTNKTVLARAIKELSSGF